MIKKSINIIKEFDIFLIIPGLFFFDLLFPFLGSIPYLDGNIDFVRSYDFYVGGFSEYFERWNSVHPPFKLFLTNLFFHVFGLTPLSYNLAGFIFGIFGILVIFYLSKGLLNRKTAMITSLLLGTSPLFLATGIFGLTDYLLSILILISLYFYLVNKYLKYFLFASLALLTKETGLLLVLSVILVEIFYFVKKLRRKKLKKIDWKILYYFSPLLVFYLWILFLDFYNQQSWNDWNFSSVAGKGSFYTVIHNLITLDFFNKYAYQQWTQLVFLNFNWVYFLMILLGIVLFVAKKENRVFCVKAIVDGDDKTKTLLSMVVFFIVYFLTVLSFQTYTIPRYALPLMPILLIGVSWSLIFLTKQILILKKVFTILLPILIYISLFYSIDPLAVFFWGRTKILGEEVYALGEHLAGNDGITYNMQYLLIVRNRTKQILSTNNSSKAVFSRECFWLFPDPNNDKRTLKILQLKNLDPDLPCQFLQ